MNNYTENVQGNRLYSRKGKLQMRTLIQFIMVFGVLGINSRRDIREKKIYVMPTIAAGVCGLLWRLIMGLLYAASMSGYWLMALLLACIPGVLLLCLAAFTGEKIGYGDGICAWAVGMWIGFERTMIALILGLIFVCAAVIFCRVRRQKVLEWPFIPFFTAGVLLVLLCRGI